MTDRAASKAYYMGLNPTKLLVRIQLEAELPRDITLPPDKIAWPAADVIQHLIHFDPAAKKIWSRHAGRDVLPSAVFALVLSHAASGLGMDRMNAARAPMNS